MERIIRCKEHHREIALKAFRRIDETPPGCKTQEELLSALENETLFIVESSQRVSGYAIVSKSIQGTLFGNESGASSKMYDLMEEIGLEEENVILIQAYGIDPAFSYQAEAKKIFDFLASRYEKPVMLFWVEEELKPNQIAFLKHIRVHEFHPHFPFEGRLFYKRFEPEGLARGFAW